MGENFMVIKGNRKKAFIRFYDWRFCKGKKERFLSKTSDARNFIAIAMKMSTLRSIA